MLETAAHIPMFVPVGPELIIILLVLLLLFGANRIPKLARAAGQSVNEFQKGRKESTQKKEQEEITADEFDFDRN